MEFKEMSDAELDQLRIENNPDGASTGFFLGRCSRCGSNNLWYTSEEPIYGCNCCGAEFQIGNLYPMNEPLIRSTG